MRRLKRFGGFLLLVSLGLCLVSTPVLAKNPWSDGPPRPGNDRITFVPGHKNDIITSPAQHYGNNGRMAGSFDLLLDMSCLMGELLYEQDEAYQADRGQSDRQASETPKTE